MKLFHAANSPFARKVMACAIEHGIDSLITLVPCSGEDAALVEVNPLGKLPCLVTSDGVALFDSRVICEYLDTVGSDIPLFPAHGPRFRALRYQALGDGISDAAVLMRGEMARPADEAHERAMARQTAKIDRSLDLLESDPPAEHIDIGSIAVACALGYLDVRFPAHRWREGRPRLAAWAEAVGKRPCLARTVPPG